MEEIAEHQLLGPGHPTHHSVGVHVHQARSKVLEADAQSIAQRELSQLKNGWSQALGAMTERREGRTLSVECSAKRLLDECALVAVLRTQLALEGRVRVMLAPVGVPES